MKRLPALVLLVLAAIAVAACAQSAGSCSNKQACAVVERFGERLQLISLQSPTAEEDIRAHYSDVVSPTLLEQWALALPAAPGRMVSSPWPDRIEVTAIDQLTPGRFSVTGEIVEMTSWEVTHGGVANEIPISVVVEDVEGRCLITAYEEVSPNE